MWATQEMKAAWAALARQARERANLSAGALEKAVDVGDGTGRRWRQWMSCTNYPREWLQVLEIAVKNQWVTPEVAQAVLDARARADAARAQERDEKKRIIPPPVQLPPGFVLPLEAPPWHFVVARAPGWCSPKEWVARLLVGDAATEAAAPARGRASATPMRRWMARADQFSHPHLRTDAAIAAAAWVNALNKLLPIFSKLQLDQPAPKPGASLAARRLAARREALLAALMAAPWGSDGGEE